MASSTSSAWSRCDDSNNSAAGLNGDHGAYGDTRTGLNLKGPAYGRLPSLRSRWRRWLRLSDRAVSVSRRNSYFGEVTQVGLGENWLPVTESSPLIERRRAPTPCALSQPKGRS